jgi:hypothetical protein
MSWQSFVDAYDVKARLIPTVIVLLPVLWTAYYLWPALLSNPFLLAGSGITLLSSAYLASMCVRVLGVRFGLHFWRQDGGLPSTRLARMRDPFFQQEQKVRIQRSAFLRFGIRLLSLQEELSDPDEADRRIAAAFREVKEYLRQSNQPALLEKHNAEYAFARNLCGSRSMFVFFAIAGLILCGFNPGPVAMKITALYGSPHAWAFNVGCGLNLAFLLFGIVFGWILLPGMLRLHAECYARRAWVTFLTLSTEPASGDRPKARTSAA